MHLPLAAHTQLGAYREVLDPRNVLANDWLNAIFPAK